MKYLDKLSILKENNIHNHRYHRQEQNWPDQDKYYYTVFEIESESNLIVKGSCDIYHRPSWDGKYDEDYPAVIWVLENVWVPEKFRKQKIGNFLLDITEKDVPELGGTEIRLFVEKDSWMRKWYESLGYEYVKDKPDSDEVWLRKILVVI